MDQPIHNPISSPSSAYWEIWNGVVEELQGPELATDKWDILLTAGYNLWGTASDDAHHPEHRGRGWVMVDSEKDEASVLAALKAGRFYASTGVEIRNVQLDGNRLHVVAPDAQVIRFVAERGQVRHRADGREAVYEIRPTDVYVRVEAYGAGMARAWTNPVFLQGEESDALREDFRNWYLKQPCAQFA